MATPDQNKQMAKRLKDEGKRAPSHWNGCGRDNVVAAGKMGVSWKGRYSSEYERGMLGGVLAQKAKDVDVLTDERPIVEHKQNYSNMRIVVDENTNKDLLDLFIKSYDRMSEKAKAYSPAVVTKG